MGRMHDAPLISPENKDSAADVVAKLPKVSLFETISSMAATPEELTATIRERYEALADATQDVWFVGRLATYRYYNMDQIVGQALATFTKIDASLPPEAANDDAEALRRAAAGD